MQATQHMALTQTLETVHVYEQQQTFYENCRFKKKRFNLVCNWYHLEVNCRNDVVIILWFKCHSHFVFYNDAIKDGYTVTIVTLKSWGSFK